MQLRQLTETDVAISIYCEPLAVTFVGNCSHIDEATDRRAEQWIREQLESGNEWAWCYVDVTAEWEGFRGRSTLSWCSYQSEADFCQEGGYFADMKAEALAELNDEIHRIATALSTLQIN